MGPATVRIRPILFPGWSSYMMTKRAVSFVCLLCVIISCVLLMHAVFVSFSFFSTILSDWLRMSLKLSMFVSTGT